MDPPDIAEAIQNLDNIVEAIKILNNAKVIKNFALRTKEKLLRRSQSKSSTDNNDEV